MSNILHLMRNLNKTIELTKHIPVFAGKDYDKKLLE